MVSVSWMPGMTCTLLVHEMADIGAFLDVEFAQQVVMAGGGIDFRGDLGVGEMIGDLIGLAELAFDLDEKRNHSCLQPAPGRPQSSKIAAA